MQTITYMPYFISSVVIASMVVQFLSPSSGIVNNIIAAMGGERQYFMVQPESFRTIYTLMNLWKNGMELDHLPGGHQRNQRGTV